MIRLVLDLIARPSVSTVCVHPMPSQSPSLWSTWTRQTASCSRSTIPTPIWCICAAKATPWFATLRWRQSHPSCTTSTPSRHPILSAALVSCQSAAVTSVPAKLRASIDSTTAASARPSRWQCPESRSSSKRISTPTRCQTRRPYRRRSGSAEPTQIHRSFHSR